MLTKPDRRKAGIYTTAISISLSICLFVVFFRATAALPGCNRSLCRHVVSVCPSVRPFVWVSVMFIYCVKTSKHVLKLFHPLVATIIFHTKRYGNIPTGPPLTGVPVGILHTSFDAC